VENIAGELRPVTKFVQQPRLISTQKSSAQVRSQYGYQQERFKLVEGTMKALKGLGTKGQLSVGRRSRSLRADRVLVQAQTPRIKGAVKDMPLLGDRQVLAMLPQQRSGMLPFVIQKRSVEQRSVFRQIPVQTANQTQMQRTYVRQVNSQIPIRVATQTSNSRSILRQNQAQAQQQVQVPVQIPVSMGTPRGQFTFKGLPRPTPVTTGTGGFFPYLQDSYRRRRKKKMKAPRRSYAYVPSIFASQMGLRGLRPSPISGLGRNPLLRR